MSSAKVLVQVDEDLLKQQRDYLLEYEGRNDHLDGILNILDGMLDYIHENKERDYLVGVAAINAGGEPDFFFTWVKCTERERDDGIHYGIANTTAAEEGYEPRMAFDATDAAANIISGNFDAILAKPSA
jgi:hypothetical protein